MSAPTPGRRHDPYAALRHRDLRIYLLSRIAGSIGSQMQAVAIGWQVYERTRSPLSLGLIGMAGALPALTLALFAGHLADRTDRRGILLITQSVQACCSLGLVLATLLEGRSVLPIYAILFLRGIAGGFQGPAASALLPQLTPPEDLPNAITWRTTLGQASSLLGPVLGGLLLAWRRDPSHVYAVDALLGLATLAAIALIPPQPAQRWAGSGRVLESLREGIRFVWSRGAVLGAISLDLFAVLFGGAVALLPVFARDILHVGPQGLGALQAAPSAGAVVTALALLHRPPIRRSGRTLLGVVALFGLSMIGFGLSRSFALSWLLLALSGAVDNVSMVIRGTVVQALTPNAMRGRVSAVNSLFVGASNQVGGFESGVTAQIMGPVASVVLGGALTLVVVAYSAWRWPELRALGRLDALGAEGESGVPPAAG